MKTNRKIYVFFILLSAIFCNGMQDAHALDINKLSLDSVAAWGKFPRFCVNTYRWGDRFFNGYDTVYVEGTGYRFNGKVRVKSWSDLYHPRFENKTSMTMVSDPSTTLGFYLTYMAVSAGYDINVSKYFGSSAKARRRWQFAFNCMLFSAEFYWITNDVGTTIRRFDSAGGAISNLDMPFDGIKTSEWGLNACYFFNHKKYSQAAAFNYARIQKRSGGSFYAGFSFTRQNYNFNFSGIPGPLLQELPGGLPDYRYTLNCKTYAFMGGYGYNWVFAPKWNFGVTVAPMVGWTNGYVVQQDDAGATFAALVRGKLGVVWNNRQWFASGTASFQGNLVGSRQRNILTSYFTFEVAAGFRFNLW